MGAGLLWGELTIVVVPIVLAEVAYRRGVGDRRATDEHIRSQTTIVQGTTLALLGLLLAFAMSMAEGRFTARRVLIRDEANAIGTAYLRTWLLPAPDGDRTRALMREYVQARREFTAAGYDQAAIERSSVRCQALQQEIWTIGVTVARAHPDWDVMSAYLESLNLMIDLEGSRYAATYMRTPPTIFVLVMLAALVAIASTGYVCGLGGRRTVLSNLALPGLIGMACALVVDLDHPRAGLVTTGDAAMQRVQDSMAE